MSGFADEGGRDYKIEAPRALAELRRGKYKMRAYVVPETNGCDPVPLRMALLSCDEIQECHASAVAQLRNDRNLDPTDLVNAQTLEDETLNQILFRALRQPEGDAEVLLHPDATDCRKTWTPDERALLADIYNDFRSEVDPDPRLMPMELVAEIRELVKKKDEAKLSAFGGRRLALYTIISADLEERS